MSIKDEIEEKARELFIEAMKASEYQNAASDWDESKMLNSTKVAFRYIARAFPTLLAVSVSTSSG